MRPLSQYLLLILLFCSATIVKSQNYRDSLHVAGKDQYLRQVKANPDKALVEIVKYIPNIRLDIRYATTNNLCTSKCINRRVRLRGLLWPSN